MKEILKEWKNFLNEQDAVDLPVSDSAPPQYNPPKPRFNPKVTKWLNNLTKPNEFGRLSPAFRVRMSNGQMSVNPLDYPTESDIKSDSRFCPTVDWIPFESKSYRSVEKFNDWYLHLFFDESGNMVLKRNDNKQNSNHNKKIHGSHYDYFSAMKKDMFGNCSALSYVQPGFIGHAAEFATSVARDFLKK